MAVESEPELSAEQGGVVAHGLGPMLVVAGPGSGKTRVLAERYVRLVRDGGAKPGEILLLTYSREAAGEMGRRVTERLGPGDHAVHTFHAFARRTLVEVGWLADLPMQFKVLADRAQQWLLLQTVLRDLQPSYFYPPQPRRDVRPLHELIGRAKQENVSPERLIQWAEVRVTGTGDADDQIAQLHLQAGHVYRAYQELTRAHDCLEFEDMIQMLARGLKESPALAGVVSGRYRYVMVDEYQDTNFIQSLLLERLVVPPHNLLVVADDDQSIYRFRGASLSNIQRFKQTYPSARQVALGRNYRSTLEIVGVTSRLIELYDRREQKGLESDREHGALVRVAEAPDVLSEAAWVAAECRRLLAEGVRPSAIAVLTSTNAQLVPFAQALAQLEIPFDQSGGGSLFARAEVKDLLALLRAAADPTDDQALVRLLRHPRYLLEAASRLVVSGWLRASGRPLLSTTAGDLPTLSDGELSRLARLRADVSYLADLALTADGRAVTFAALERSEYVGVVDCDDPKDVPRAAANVRRLSDLIANFQLDSPAANIHELLEYLRLASEADTEEGESPREIGLPAVRLSTVHKAKGLEFDHVFVVNVSEGMFPFRGSERRLDLPQELVEADIGNPDPMDEQRRLFYVAMTRAKETLTLVHAKRYRDWERDERPPSRFLAELRAHVPHLLSELHAPQVALPPVRAVTPPATAPDPMVVQSVSELLNFSECPLRYAYQNEYQLPQRPSRELVLGTLIHAALEQGGRRRIKGEAVTDEDLGGFLDGAWTLASFDKIAWRDLRAEAQKVLAAYAQTPYWTSAEIVEAERDFEVDVDGIRFKGRIDRIDRVGDRFRLVDYKTGRAKTDAEIADDRRLGHQFGLYRIASGVLLGSVPVDMEAHFVSAASMARVSRTPEQLRKDRQWAWRVAKDIAESRAARRFPAKPSDFACPSCSFRLICDEGQAYLRRRAKER